MTFLKKLGSIILNVAGVASGIGPIASAIFPQYAGQINTGLNVINQLSGIVVQAEVFGQALGLSGPDKLKAASAAATQLILQSDLLVGRKIDNVELFKAGCQKLTDGMADILNSLDDKIEVDKKD